MVDNLGLVCREYNNQAIRTLELIDDYIKCKNKIEETMKYGFLDIAKARYIMGNHTISSLQLPNENSNEFEALATVMTSAAEDDGPMQFMLNSTSTLKEGNNSKEDTTTNIRKRTKDHQTESVIYEDEEKVIQVTAIPKDPLKWFGVLVPQNLRRAQISFKTVLELTMTCATIQLELEMTKNKLRQLKEKRRLLLETKKDDQDSEDIN